jgi:hypothetical protein
MLLSIEGSTETDYYCCEKIEDNFYEEINKLKVTENLCLHNCFQCFRKTARLTYSKGSLKEQ